MKNLLERIQLEYKERVANGEDMPTYTSFLEDKILEMEEDLEVGRFALNKIKSDPEQHAMFALAWERREDMKNSNLEILSKLVKKGLEAQKETKQEN